MIKHYRTRREAFDTAVMGTFLEERRHRIYIEHDGGYVLSTEPGILPGWRLFATVRNSDARTIKIEFA